MYRKDGKSKIDLMLKPNKIIKERTMYTLELKDGSQIEIREGGSEACFSVIIEKPQEAVEILDKLTEDNLSCFKYIEPEGLYSVIKNKTLSKMQLEKEIDPKTQEVTGRYTAAFILKDVDVTALEIKYLKETVDALVLASLT